LYQPIPEPIYFMDHFIKINVITNMCFKPRSHRYTYDAFVLDSKGRTIFTTEHHSSISIVIDQAKEWIKHEIVKNIMTS
jgi:hypothetical protein